MVAALQFYNTLWICPKSPGILDYTKSPWLILKNIFFKSPSVFCCVKGLCYIAHFNKKNILEYVQVRLLRMLEFNTAASVPSFSWMWQSAILKNNFCKSPSLFCCSKSTLLDAPALLALLKKWLDCAQYTVILPDWILKN